MAFFFVSLLFYLFIIFFSVNWVWVFVSLLVQIGSMSANFWLVLVSLIFRLQVIFAWFFTRFGQFMVDLWLIFGQFMVDFGSIFGQFLLDLCLIFGWFLADCWSILSSILVNFWLIFGWFLVDFWLIAGQFWAQFWSIISWFLVDLSLIFGSLLTDYWLILGQIWISISTSFTVKFHSIFDHFWSAFGQLSTRKHFV